MKLYFLNPNNWAEHWTTCANSPEEALEQIKEFIKKQTEEENYSDYIWDLFKNATVDNLPKNYTLQEFPLNHVIEGEYS